MLALSRRPQPGGVAGVTWRVTDFGDAAELAALLQETGVRRLLHLATAMLETERDFVQGFRANTGSTAVVFEAAHRAGLERVVNCSSKAVFGAPAGVWGHPEFRPIEEDHPRQPHSVYAFTKMVGEDLAAFCRAAL